MLDIDEKTARRVIDAIAIAIDGKPSSAKTFSPTPFSELAEFASWGQDANNSLNDTRRTDALTVAYLVFSGGRIPLQGIEMRDAWFRPDKWVVGALIKKDRARIDEATSEVIFTQAGWEWIAGVLTSINQE